MSPDTDMKIAVAGASGRVGPHLVDVLAERGHEVVPISRTHGVVGLTETAALDYGPKGIRVNAVAPGPILTERGIGTAPAEVQEQVAQRLPIKRLGTSEEVAHAAAWLLSDASSFVNGATLSIDGGKLAGSAAW